MRHKTKRFTAGFIAAISLLLSACGGSGGDTPDPPNLPASGPTAEDTENARAAQVRVLFKAESGELTIEWTDTFATESSYRIERQLASGGGWEVQESLPATPGTDTANTWSRIIDRSATYRVVAVRDSYVVPLESEQGVTDVRVDLAARTMTLLVDQTEPLHGSVHLSVEGATSAGSVEYFVDLDSIGTSSAGPSFPAEWHVRAVSDGSHLLIAHVHEGPGLRVELRRAVLVDNPVAISLDNGPMRSGVATFQATATSDAGIASVEFFLNGTSIGMGTSFPGSDVWVVSFDTRSLPAGPVTLRALAIDNEGEQAEASEQFIIDNPAALTLESPFDGAIVSGSLEIRGTLRDDGPGTLVKISLGDVKILESSQGSFATNYSLAGLPGGQYTLTIAVRDSSGQARYSQLAVVVNSSTTFTYTHVGTFGAGDPLDLDRATSLLDTDSGALLYRTPDRIVRWHRPAAEEITLEGSSNIHPPGIVDSRAGGVWQLEGDRVTTVGRLAPVGQDPAHVAETVFLFDSSGQREEVPHDLDRDALLRSGLHDRWLVLGRSSIYVRDLTSQTSYGPIQGDMFRGHAFVTTPGQEALFFIRETGSPGNSATFDLFRYRLADQSILQLSAGEGRALRPKADASRVAWEKASIEQSLTLPPFELLAAPISNPTASSIMSTQMISFDLNDGVLAWSEWAASVYALRVDDSEGAFTLSSTASTNLYSTANGYVIFGENGKLYVWSRAQGKRVLLDTLPAQVIQRDGVAFLTTGLSKGTIYRVAF